MLYDDLSDNQKDVYHALNSLGNIGKMVVVKHNDMESFDSIKQWSVAFALWIIRADYLTPEEMDEVMEFGKQEEERQKKEALQSLGSMLRDILGDNLEGIDQPNSDDPIVQDLNELFNAPSFGEDSDVDTMDLLKDTFPTAMRDENEKDSES